MERLCLLNLYYFGLKMGNLDRIQLFARSGSTVSGTFSQALVGTRIFDIQAL